MLNYRVADEIFALEPGYRLGVLVFEGCDNTRGGAEAEALLRAAEADARRRWAACNVVELPEVAAWRDVYRRFGAKPAEHRSSIEAMLRRVLKPDALPAINPLVDIGNAMSLRHGLPVGVHPLAALPVSIELRTAREGDRFIAVEGTPPETPGPGEVVLARGAEVLTRRWTWRQAVLTRTLPEATRVWFNIDALPAVGGARGDAATAALAAMTDVVDAVQAHCGGRLVHRALLDAANPSLSCPLSDR